MTEAEKGILGCILLESNVLYEIYNKLKPDMFSSDFGHDCFEEMLAMYDRGESINVISLSQALENRKWDALDIGQFLKECISSAVTSAMLKSYTESDILISK